MERLKELEQVHDKALKYDLIKISINTFLESYQDTLKDFKRELENYRIQDIQPLVELKKEHCDLIRGKIEMLTILKDR